ncbi:MAG TPA: hypothetical protein DCG53_11600 [Syntrophus sp. (in: bacteria)]|nr:hypothetical protein [Syntrophus sp. (in: bacteria)]
MATTKSYKPNQLYAVPLADLQADANQPRKFLDPQALEELTASVTQHGILEPILFRQDKKAGVLYVVAGERRCAASLEASGKKVTAIDFNALTESDRTIVIEAITGLKDTLENALFKVLK